MSAEPVEIRDVIYRSGRAAAAAVKVKPNTISTALARGTIDNAGRGSGNHGKQKPPIKPVLMMVGKRVYRSTRAAARETGMSRYAIKKLRRAQKKPGPLLLAAPRKSDA